MNKEDKLDYLAGFVDGDGNIGLSNTSISLVVSNTNVQVMYWMLNNFGGSVTTSIRKTPGNKKQYRWTVNGHNAYKLLKQLRCRLILKNEQADICIHIYDKITKWHIKKAGLPIWAKRIYEESYNKLKALNMKEQDKSMLKLSETNGADIDNKNAYLSGIIDSEGSVELLRNKTKSSYSIRVNIGNTDPRICKWLEKYFKGAFYIQEKKKVQYRWQVGGKDAYNVLKSANVYLLLKAKQSVMCIDMYERVTRNFRGRKHPVWTLKFQELCYQTVRNLNKKGSTDTSESELVDKTRISILKGERDINGYYIQTSKIDIDVPLHPSDLYFWEETRKAIIEKLNGIVVDINTTKTERGMHCIINWLSNIKYDDEFLNFIQFALSDDIIRYAINARRIEKGIKFETANILFSKILKRYPHEQDSRIKIALEREIGEIK